MNKHVALTLFFLFSAFSPIFSQGCPLTFFTLSTQAEVDAFDDDHPECTELAVKMTITGNDITNLDGLNLIQSTLNSIEIIDNPMLTSLNGLSNLTSIGLEFKVVNNDMLQDFTGLGNLTFIGGHLLITGNQNLQTLDGIGQIPTLGSYLSISFNPSLTDITALNSITEVGPNYTGGFLEINNNNVLPAVNGLDLISETGSYFSLASNPAMTTINGLNGLTTVRGDFSVNGNASLSDLNAFASLTTIDDGNSGNGGEDFIIDFNPALTNIDEFNNLTTISGGLIIVANPSLSNCVADGICAYVSPPGQQSFLISNNAVGCNDETQVEAACLAAPVELTFFRGKYENDEALLSWQTSSEKNNDYFLLEHSTNGRDFKTLDKIPGKGTTSEVSNYQYRHWQPAKGINYYRLKQVDFDETFAYSNMAVVITPYDEEADIFPNPTTGPVFIKGNAPERFGSVTDLAGRVILEKDLSASSRIDLTDQPAGIYFLEIRSGAQRVVRRVVKE